MSPISKLVLAAGALAVVAQAQSVTQTVGSSQTSSAVGHVVTAYYPVISDGDALVSVISADASATTYGACVAETASDACDFSYTIVAGPSTAGLHATLEGYTVDINCALTITSHEASCVASTASGTDTLTTSTIFSNLDDFATKVTVTDGYDKIASIATDSTDKTVTSSQTRSVSSTRTTSTETKAASSTDSTDSPTTTSGSIKDDDSAAPGQLHGAVMAGVAALFGAIMML